MAATPVQAPESRARRPTSRVVVDALLILLSVGVGYAAAEIGDYREDRALAGFVLQNVLDEVEANAAVLDSLVAKHRQWQAALAADGAAEAGPSAYDVMFAVRPGADVTIGLPLKSAAWSTAVSTGALRLFDYEVAAALSEIYGYQDLMTANHNRIVTGALYSPAAFDPGARSQTVRLLWGVMAEVSGNEGALLSLYRRHLPLLRGAAR